MFVECAAGRFFLRPTFSTVLKKKIKKKNTGNMRTKDCQRTKQGFKKGRRASKEAGRINEATWWLRGNFRRTEMAP